MPTLLRKNNVTAPLQFPTERAATVLAEAQNRPAIECQATHPRRGAADRGQRGEAAGAFAKAVKKNEAAN